MVKISTQPQPDSKKPTASGELIQIKVTSSEPARAAKPVKSKSTKPAKSSPSQKAQAKPAAKAQPTLAKPRPATAPASKSAAPAESEPQSIKVVTKSTSKPAIKDAPTAKTASRPAAAAKVSKTAKSVTKPVDKSASTPAATKTSAANNNAPAKKTFDRKIIAVICMAVVAVVAIVAGVIVLLHRSEDVIGSEVVSSAGEQDVWQDIYFNYLDDIVNGRKIEDGSLDISQVDNPQVILYQHEDWSAPILMINYTSKHDNSDHTTMAFIDTKGKLTTIDYPENYQVKHFYNLREDQDDFYLLVTAPGRSDTCYHPAQQYNPEHKTDAGSNLVYCVEDTEEVVSKTDNNITTIRGKFEDLFYDLDDVINSFDLKAAMLSEELGKEYEQAISALRKARRNSQDKVAKAKAALNPDQDDEEDEADKDEDKDSGDQPQEDVKKPEPSNKNNKNTSDTNRNFGSSNNNDSGNASNSNNSSTSSDNSASGGNNSSDDNNVVRNGIQVGDTLIPYGTYMELNPNDNSDGGGRVEIRANGTATLRLRGTAPVEATYRVESYNFTQDPAYPDYRSAIVFYSSAGVIAAYFPYNGYLASSGPGALKFMK